MKNMVSAEILNKILESVPEWERKFANKIHWGRSWIEFREGDFIVLLVGEMNMEGEYEIVHDCRGQLQVIYRLHWGVSGDIIRHVVGDGDYCPQGRFKGGYPTTYSAFGSTCFRP